MGKGMLPGINGGAPVAVVCFAKFMRACSQFAFVCSAIMCGSAPGPGCVGGALLSSDIVLI